MPDFLIIQPDERYAKDWQFFCSIRFVYFTLNILALDASTEYLSLALWQDGLVTALDIHAGQTHSQIILPRIRELLDQQALQMADLDGIAFGEGPGSFTGLRISCGVAQGLAFGANLPVVGVSTLMALAHASGHGKVIACLDARMGEVYMAAYEKAGDAWLEVKAAGLYKPEQLPALTGAGWLGVGSGWDAYAAQLNAVYAGQLQEVITGRFPSALAMAQLAAPKFAAGQGLSASQAAPVYVRNKVAFTTQEREKLAN